MRFFEYVRGIAKEYGLPEVNGRPLGGGSDAASTTMAGVPTICSCGVRGQWNHTMKEYAVVDSIFDRSKMYVAARGQFGSIRTEMISRRERTA